MSGATGPDPTARAAGEVELPLAGGQVEGSADMDVSDAPVTEEQDAQEAPNAEEPDVEAPDVRVPDVSIGAEGTKWGNRIPLAPIVSVVVLALLDAVLAVLSALVWPSTVLLVVYGVVLIILAAALCVLLAVRHAWSFSGGRAEGMLDAHLLSLYVDFDAIVGGCGDDAPVRVLDVGCSTSALSVMCAKADPRVEVTGVDAFGSSSALALETACENARLEGVESQCTFENGDISALDFADGAFDVVVSSFAFDAAPEKERAALVRESLRVLREGGTFALMSDFGAPKSSGDVPAIVSEFAEEGFAEVAYDAGIAEGEWLPAGALGRLTLRGAGVLHGVK